MVTSRRPDPDSDPFRPPAVATEVGCLHCGREYDSYLIEWREELGENREALGFWCCPTPGCDGKGFGFDILPTDPDYQDEHGGWVSFDEDEDEEFSDEYDEEEEFDVDSEIPPWPEVDHESKDGNGNGNLDDIPF